MKTINNTTGVLLLLATFTLGGCGLKGDLYLEEAPQVEAAADTGAAEDTAAPARKAAPRIDE